MKKMMKSVMAAVAVMLIITVSLIPAVTDDGSDADPTDQVINHPNVVMNLADVCYGFGNWYYYLGNLLSGKDVSHDAGDAEAVKAYARLAEATNTAEKLILVSKLSASLVDNDRQTWTLTSSYLNRAAEISAGGAWSEGAAYDADGTLTAADIYTLLSRGNGNTANALDWGYDTAGNVVSAWKADSVFSSMTVQMVWNGGSTAVSASDIGLDYCTIVTATDDHQLVYIDASRTSDVLARTIYAFQTGTATPVSGTATTYNLAVGANSIATLGMTSGWYVLSNGVYGAPALPSVSAAGAACVGGVAIVCDDTVGYAVQAADGGLTISYGGSSYSSAYLRYSLNHGAGTVDTTSDVDYDVVAKMVSTYGDYYSELKNRLSDSAQAGRVMWNLSQSAHESCTLLSPSSVIPQLEGLSISSDQAYSIYVAALDQIGQYNDDHGDVLAGNDVQISQQSLKLYCRGTIYDSNGGTVASNVIFTPYVYLKDMQISTGTDVKNEFESTGMIMVWDRGQTSLSGFTAATEKTMIVADRGMYFTVDEMNYDGSSATSVTLKVKTISEIGISGGADKGTPTVPKVFNAAVLISAIIVELGIIVAMLGYMFGRPIVIIIGAAVVLIGLFGGTFITDLIYKAGWL